MKETEIILLPIACNYESFVAFGYRQSADREQCKYATAVRSGDADTDYAKDEPKASGRIFNELAFQFQRRGGKRLRVQ